MCAVPSLLGRSAPILPVHPPLPQPNAPAEHLTAMRSVPKVRVVEETPRIVLVEASEHDLRDLPAAARRDRG
jgi:hypothetical protein